MIDASAGAEGGAGGPGASKPRRGRPKLPDGVKGKYTNTRRLKKVDRPAGKSKAPEPVAVVRAPETVEAVQAAEAATQQEEAEANEAERARRRARRKGEREGAVGGQPAPKVRSLGWLRTGNTENRVGRHAAVLRDVARAILDYDFLPYAQELIADPDAKDGDKLRAGDILAKMAVGYMTPEQMSAEDAVDLPAPVFTATEGELPPANPWEAEDAKEDADAVTEEPAAAEQRTPAESVSGPQGYPMPHVGAA